MPNDIYGRTVTLITANGQDVYTVSDGVNQDIILSVPAGEPEANVYTTINSMAPANYTPPQD